MLIRVLSKETDGKQQDCQDPETEELISIAKNKRLISLCNDILEVKSFLNIEKKMVEKSCNILQRQSQFFNPQPKHFFTLRPSMVALWQTQIWPPTP